MRRTTTTGGTGIGIGASLFLLSLLSLSSLSLSACQGGETLSAAEANPPTAPPAAPASGDGPAAPPASVVVPPKHSATACEATSPRPAPVEIVVTPDDGDARLLALLTSAASTVDVTIYELTSYHVIDGLKAAAARGVKVRIIQDRRQASSTKIADLRAAGIDVRTSSHDFTYTHQKTVIIDAAAAPSSRAAFVFSGNLDRLSFGTGRNYGVIDRDADDIADLEELFEADWAGRAPNLACTRLVVAPVNARARVLDLIASSKTTLDIEAMYITDADVENAVALAHARGVTVRVLLNDPSHDLGDSTEAVTRFNTLGISVRRSGPLFIHAKLIACDGLHAFIGSENFSDNSLDRNREVGVVVSSTDTDISRVGQTFTLDWTNATPF